MITSQPRSVLVVGASSGMGAAIVNRLALSGDRVTASARRQKRLDELQADLSRRGAEIDIIAADVSRRDDVERLVATAAERMLGIDVLVYAAATNIPDRSLSVLKPETWDMMLATNLTGAFDCTRAVLPVMRQAERGLIVYISTAAVQMPDVSGVAYQASKHGLSGLAHGTRVEEKKNGIRTTVIFPGLCDTEMLDKRPTPTPREVVDLALKPEDVADAVHFVTRLDPRAVVPEMQLLPSRL